MKGLSGTFNCNKQTKNVMSKRLSSGDITDQNGGWYPILDA